MFLVFMENLFFLLQDFFSMLFVAEIFIKKPRVHDSSMRHWDRLNDRDIERTRNVRAALRNSRMNNRASEWLKLVHLISFPSLFPSFVLLIPPSYSLSKLNRSLHTETQSHFISQESCRAICNKFQSIECVWRKNSTTGSHQVSPGNSCR